MLKILSIITEVSDTPKMLQYTHHVKKCVYCDIFWYVRHTLICVCLSVSNTFHFFTVMLCCSAQNFAYYA